MAQGGGDVGDSGQPQDGDGEVAQAGHDPGTVGCSDLRPVFVEHDVAHPVQAVLDCPVSTDDVGQLSRAGQRGSQ